jgi:hypothetical protein
VLLLLIAITSPLLWPRPSQQHANTANQQPLLIGSLNSQSQLTRKRGNNAMFEPHIEAWRQFAIWESGAVPPDLLLAIVKCESDGVAGQKSKLPSNCADLPQGDGSTIKICSDLGLTQISPQTAIFFNERAPGPPLTLGDLTGTSERAARQQLRAGAWFLDWTFRELKRTFPKVFTAADLATATPDQIRLTFAGYGGGIGSAKNKIGEALAQGVPVTWAALTRKWPNWPAARGANNKWAAYTRAQKGDPLIASVVPNAPGRPAWIPIALSIGAWWLYKQWMQQQQQQTAPDRTRPPAVDNLGDLAEKADDESEIEPEIGEV